MEQKYTRQQIIQIIHKIADTEVKDLATIGHRLRDVYGVLNLSTYNLKLKNIIDFKIDYELYTLMKKLVPLKKHIDKNSRDIHNRVQMDELVSRIKGIIVKKKRKKAVPENFNWTVETNEKLVGRYAR
jgi:small subunit ribosomal protein S15